MTEPIRDATANVDETSLRQIRHVARAALASLPRDGGSYGRSDLVRDRSRQDRTAEATGTSARWNLAGEKKRPWVAKSAQWDLLKEQKRRWAAKGPLARVRCHAGGARRLRAPSPNRP